MLFLFAADAYYTRQNNSILIERTELIRRIEACACREKE